jgi:Haem-binding uptake, Tiki superfamily, ChaN
MWTKSAVLGFVAFALIASGPAQTRQTPVRPSAKPVDPISGILDAFKTHRVVALGEGDHGNEQGHRIRLALIRDPRFSPIVTDIVVEFGNALYQPVMDRFISGGDVDTTQLRRVWQDTSQLNTVWDTPIYEEFFRAVREVNARLPPERRIRVLLGDPPIEWDRVKTFKDIFAQMREAGDRDAHPTSLIRREVLANGRRALVIYGDFHLDRTPPALRTGCQPGSTIPCFPGSIVDQLETVAGVRAFNIRTVTTVDLRTLQKDVADWPVPSLAVLRGSALGAIHYREFLPGGPLVVGPGGASQTGSPGLLRPMEEAFDAVLYLGPPSSITYARLPDALCADAEYVQMRRRRLALGPGLAPLPC